MKQDPDKRKYRVEGRWLVDAETGERIRLIANNEFAIVRDNSLTIGKRWNIAGVTYPKEVETKNCAPGSKNAPLTEPPKGYIDTAEAAALLHSSRSSARAVMHRHKVGCKLVHVSGGPPLLYWRKRNVEKLLAERAPIISEPPKGYIDSAATRAILGVGRSSLYRYVSKGKIEEKKYRLLTKRGTRNKTYYKESEVQAIAAIVKGIRQRMQELECQIRSLNIGRVSRTPKRGNPPRRR